MPMHIKRLVLPGVCVSRSLPENFDANDIEYFESELEVRLPNVYVISLENMCLTGDGLLFRGLNIMALTLPGAAAKSGYFTLKDRLKFYLINFRRSLFARCLPDLDYLWITDLWSFGYFHWMTEALPRLLVANAAGFQGSLLLPSNLRSYSFVEASLNPLFSGKVVYTDKINKCKRLSVPTPIAQSGIYNEGLMKSLRSIYFKASASFAERAILSDRIYISRSKASKRRVLNEDELIPVLERYGFQLVFMEDHDFQSQVSICQAAKFLISNHGGGLTNMLYMKEGSSVLELRKSDDYHNNCYFALASAMGLKYFYQLCAASLPTEDSHTADVIVDSFALEANICAMLSFEKSID